MRERIVKVLAFIIVISLLGNSKAYASTPIEVRASALNGEDISTHLGDTIGNYKLTGYCSCAICNGRWVNQPTKLGTGYTEDLTIAVDPRYIPLGSFIWLNIQGVGWRLYQAQDTGGAIKGNRIDIYVGNNHGDCYNNRFNVVTEVRAYIP